MGIDADQLRVEIVRPALHAIGLHSVAAEDLVMGTAAQESRLKYVKQLGKGPALSIYQIEPATYNDYWDNFLEHRPKLAQKIIDYCGISEHSFTADHRPDVERLVYDLRYATIMCRIHYRRIRAPLPKSGDILGYANYWKKYYNTYLGHGSVEQFINSYQLVN
jgi:hypothetical protein